MKIEQTKRLMVVTGGGDCPGLNAVIRAIVRSGIQDNWEILGSKRAFNGIIEDPQDIVRLDASNVAGIHVKGGTILETVNNGDPFAFPVVQSDGQIRIEDVSDRLIERLRALNISGVINIGGDGSQRISLQLYKKGVNILGVPKTIDNDLSATDYTFGFQTAVEIATEAVDKLVSTASSHNRLMIAEVMGRDSGWIALHCGIAAGADIVLIPEIPYDIDIVIKKIKSRIQNNHGFAIVVVSEGAYSRGGKVVSAKSDNAGYHNPVLGGIGYQLLDKIKSRMDVEGRVTVLGHIQRGGTPLAFDRVLATQFGVRAFEMVKAGRFGIMIALRHTRLTSVTLESAVNHQKKVQLSDDVVCAARAVGICLGDDPFGPSQVV